MEVAVVAVAAVLAVAVLILALVLWREMPRSASEPTDGPFTAPSRSLELSARANLAVVEHDDCADLLLGDVRLLSLEPWAPEPASQIVPITGTFSTWIGSMLDNPRVLEYIAGERWVLAKVPQAIRDGGEWMVSKGTPKAVARQPGSSQWAAIPELVRGGASTGTAAALGPAIIGAVAVAYAHHEITAGLDRIEGRVKDLEGRLQAADLGIIEGSRRLLREMEEWGTPHRWPEQLLLELAVRRVALDPVCFTQRAAFDRLAAAMRKNGKQFNGLAADERAELERTLKTLSLAIMTRAQIGFATTMMLLDGVDAPFGLERLSRLTQDFVDEMTRIVDDLQTVLDGERPGRIGSLRNQVLRIHQRKIAPTEKVVTELLAALAEVTASISEEDDRSLVLSVRDGQLELGTPQLALGAEEEEGEGEASPPLFAIDANTSHDT